MNRPASIEYIKQIAIREGLDIVTVTNIIKSQFEFLAKVLDEGDRTTFTFKTVMFANLGKFTSTPSKISKLKKLSKPRYETARVRKQQLSDQSTSTGNTGV
jgi:hypothetical protein